MNTCSTSRLASDHRADDLRSPAAGLRLRVLLPLAAALVLLLSIFVSIFVHETGHRQAENIARTAASVEAMFREQSAEGVQVVRSIMELVLQNKHLDAALRARDRQKLLDLSTPILNEIRSKNRITHFYYILPDRTMLLRVQAPNKYGDRIDRFVLQEAQRTGKPFWGNEQGPLGSFTLRVVYPWTSDGEVIGYLEMGIEFEDIMQSIKKFLDVDILVAIEKTYFDRAKWEEAQSKRERPVPWDEFPAVVVLSRTVPTIPPPITAYLADLKAQHSKRSFEIAWDGKVAQTIVVPFANLRGQELGELVVIRDITAGATERRHAITSVALLGTLIGGALMLFFHLLLGRVQRDVAERTERLSEARRVLTIEQLERQRAQRELGLQQERNELLEARSRMMEDLAAAKEAAESANRAKSEFLSAMSHELRTPLNAILGYAQILRRDAHLTERQATGLATIAQSGQHLLTLINDLLDLAKVEAGKFDLAPAAVNLPAVLAVVADIIRVKAEEKRLIFACEVPLDLPQAVLADEKRLRQVLLNLLGNAVKFTDSGQVSLKVSAPSRDAASIHLRFEIADSGIGVAPEHLEHIFQPFEQVGEARRRSGGTGLGLAISRQLVQLMGSDIHVESRAGAGSRFWFDLTLPLAAAPAETAARPASGYAGARRKLLIVDDLVGNRALLVDLLGGLGFDLCEAVNGEQAIAQVQAQRPDLVLMDLVMPVMDGMEAIRRLRATPGLESLPIIAVSASADDAERAASLASGADAFQPKPFDQERLLASIGKLLKLEWTYAAAATPVPTEGAAAELVVPPLEEMRVLHQFALAGDMRAIRQWANHLAALEPRYLAFADTLRHMASEYRSKAILDLVERHLRMEQTS